MKFNKCRRELGGGLWEKLLKYFGALGAMPKIVLKNPDFQDG